MVRAAYAANLVMALLGLGLCLWHAWPERDRLTFLATAIVYGVLLEQIVIIAFEAYTYSVEEFILTVGDVPVVIGFGWAALIYSGQQIGHRLSISHRAMPAFVALFALHVDLAIDAVAIRVPFWSWTPPGAWFGVALGNFLGWYLVAALFSAGWLALASRTDRFWIIGPATVGVSLAGLIVILEGWTRYVSTVPAKAAVLIVLIVASLGWVALDRPTPRSLDPRLSAVPLLYHGFYFGLLIWFEMYREQPWLPVISITMILAGLVIHADAIQRWRGSATTSRT